MALLLVQVLILFGLVNFAYGNPVPESSNTQRICDHIMSPPGTGYSNQDRLGTESQDACMKNLFMIPWWPENLGMWSTEQWCRETIKHDIITDRAFPVPNVRGKQVLITGGDTGLGFATMKALSESGAVVSYTSRNCDCKSNPYSVQWPQQCEELAALREAVNGTYNYLIKCYNLDLVKGDSIAQFVSDAKRDFNEGLDVLVNNAGLVDKEPGNIFNCNFLGTYAVTKGLWEVLLTAANKGRDVRIITTSSIERYVLNQRLTASAYSFFNIPGISYSTALSMAEAYLNVAVNDSSVIVIPVSYSLSKLADFQFALRLQNLVRSSPSLAQRISVFTTHPGASHTLMTRNIAVGQMSRDQGVLPNLLAISMNTSSLKKGTPLVIGPALSEFEMERYFKLDQGRDDTIKQTKFTDKFQKGLLDDSIPLEALFCLQVVGYPMLYPYSRLVELDVELQKKLWNIAERGLEEVYGQPWIHINATWTGIVP